MAAVRDTQLPATATQCWDWYAAIDTAVALEKVRDSSEVRMAGFPYLRMDCFATSFKTEAARDATVRAEWK